MTQYITYVLYAMLILLLVRRFLPVKGLVALTSDQVQNLLQKPHEYQFVDVREVHEYQRGHIKGFRNLPLSQLRQRVKELDRTKSVVLTCQSGMRSKKAASLLRKMGFQQISHLKTGVGGWNGKLI